MPASQSSPDQAQASTYLRVSDLVRGYGRLRVLSGVSTYVEQGEVLLITGHNGCGKSTLLRCLAGLTAPQRGTIECAVDGHQLDIYQRRLSVGYVAPDLELYGELTTAENLDFFSRLRRVSPDRGRRLLDRLKLPQNRLASALSSGMRQRLRWAWALLHQPRILLLDEPLQNLDQKGRDDLLDLLDEHLQSGLAIIANPDRLEWAHVAHHLDLGR